MPVCRPGAPLTLAGFVYCVEWLDMFLNPSLEVQSLDIAGKCEWSNDHRGSILSSEAQARFSPGGD